MKNFIELTLCTATKEEFYKTIINTNSIVRIDNTTPTRIWLKEFDDFIYITESYNYLNYELLKKTNK